MAEVTATEAARRFSDLLNRVRYNGESFEVVRGGEVVARIVPTQTRRADVRRLFELLARSERVDDGLADDLEHIQRAQPASPGDPWGT